MTQIEIDFGHHNDLFIKKPVNLRDDEEAIEEVIKSFKSLSKLSKVNFEVKDRTDGKYIKINLANPTNRFYKLLEECILKLPEDNAFKSKVTISKLPQLPNNRMLLPETQLLKTVLSESLTVSQNSFPNDFFGRYIKSVTGDEEQILSLGNHIVYGRRGAGKSSLLAYAWHTFRKEKIPVSWINMQAYSQRKDYASIVSILDEIISQIKDFSNDFSFDKFTTTIPDILYQDDIKIKSYLDRSTPLLRAELGKIAQKHGSLFFLLDDIHVLSKEIQPLLLDKIYSLSRGNNCYLKISGIEQFVRLKNSKKNMGLESPGDVQIIKLDNNLTMPDKSKIHINNILDTHAIYCGLPGISSICNRELLDRLVWASAGVPRDALYLFSKAIGISTLKEHKRVSIMSINAVASEMTEEKTKEIKVDYQEDDNDISLLIDTIKDFCLKKHRKNVFLVEINNNNNKFKQIEELIALRFLHILHTGFTPSEAGKKYLALMLDYGFYVGIRAAKSMAFFSKTPAPIQAKEVREFPIFSIKK